METKEPKYRPALLSLGLPGHLNSVIFNSPSLTIMASTSLAPDHKSQQQPRSSILSYWWVIDLLWIRTNLPLRSILKQMKDKLCPFSSPQVMTSCAVLLLLLARGLSKDTSASQSLHKQNLPYLGSPQNVQHVLTCSVFVSYGHCQQRQYRCCHKTGGQGH